MWELLPPKMRLIGQPSLNREDGLRISNDWERFRSGLPHPLEPYLAEAYGLDLSSKYAEIALKNPFGKASGQLSLARHQVEQDADGGLGFVVLKTVIAQDSQGERSMREWAIPETKMAVEVIRGRSGDEGHTVTWKGRGWSDTFDGYCELFSQALRAGCAANMLVVPSVKYHLPGIHELVWREDEYQFTTSRLLETWQEHCGDEAMPLEKDFSPTLAGSDRSRQRAKILAWLKRVPGLIHRTVPGARVGVKLFNALFEDEFQLEMLDALHSTAPGTGRADFLIYANRLFNPDRLFEGTQGVAYGGPDLSDRNLAILERYLFSQANRKGVSNAPASVPSPLPLSATGDIHSGRIAAEYLLRGASSFQMHTLFQLPASCFAMKRGSKTEMALHHLLFHPQEGFLAWVLDLRKRFAWPGPMNIEQMANWCRSNWSEVAGICACSAAGQKRS